MVAGFLQHILTSVHMDTFFVVMILLFAQGVKLLTMYTWIVRPSQILPEWKELLSTKKISQEEVRECEIIERQEREEEKRAMTRQAQSSWA